MDSEDDMVVVIVGDVNSQSNAKAAVQELLEPMQIKEEIVEEDEVDVKVEDLIEIAEKYGQYLSCDTPEHEEYEVIIKRSDSDDEEYVPDGEGYDDEDIDAQDEDCGEDGLCETDSDSNKRHNPRKPVFRKSFVEELRNDYPELRENPKELVEMLVKIMKSVKRPLPPIGYYDMKGKSYECLKCGNLSQTEPAVWRHYQEKHGTRYLVCYACGVDFRSTTNLYKHEKMCSARDARIVLQARAIFLGRKGRSRPFLSLVKTGPKKIYNKKLFPCTECSAVFYSRNSLEAHEHLHRGERPHRCHVCPRAYTSHSALLRHVRTHTKAQYICDHCQRSFKVKAALVAHMDTHLPQRKHACNLCDRRYLQKSALKLHIDRVHLNLPPPCACTICPKRYPRMSVLKDHMKREHGLSLMTRKMFFKALPALTDAQLQQADFALKTEVMISPLPVSLPREVKTEDEYHMDFS